MMGATNGSHLIRLDARAAFPRDRSMTLELLTGTYVIVPELSAIRLIVRPSKKACQAFSSRKRLFYEIADHRLRSLLLACNLPLRPLTARSLNRELITPRGQYGRWTIKHRPGIRQLL